MQRFKRFLKEELIYSAIGLVLSVNVNENLSQVLTNI